MIFHTEISVHISCVLTPLLANRAYLYLQYTMDESCRLSHLSPHVLLQFQPSGPHKPCEDSTKNSQYRVSEKGIRGEQVRGEQEVHCKGTTGGEISHALQGSDRVSRCKLSGRYQERYQRSSVCLLERYCNYLDVTFILARV